MADERQCTSDDPTNHQGDTCPIHENGFKIVTIVALVREDLAEELHRHYGKVIEHDDTSRAGWVETRDLTDQEAQDFAEVIADSEEDDDGRQ